MSDTSELAPLAVEGEDGWSFAVGDLLVPPGDVLGVQIKREEVGAPFSSFMVEIPTSIRPFFRVVDVSIDGISIVQPPYSIDPNSLRLGAWIQLGFEATGSLMLAVLCSDRSRNPRGGVERRRLRGVAWFRNASGRLWGESVGWTGPGGFEEFSIWRSR